MEGGIVRCRELWIHIGEWKEGLLGVGNYEYILESGRRDC